MISREESAYPANAINVIEGTYLFRVDGGEVVSTTVHIELWPGGVLVRYGDGVNHVGLRGDDVVAYFASGLAPSLRAVALARSVGP